MDTSDERGSPVTDLNGAHPVRYSKEVLLPFFTDESVHAIMALRHPPDSPTTIPTLSELRLVLLGRKGTGKSSAGNTILGGAGGFENGKPTEECVKRRADVSGRKITVVDTPGWEWYYPLNSTPNWVRRETLRSVSLCPPGPHAVLLVVRSCASVTDSYITEIEEHLEPLGKEVWEYTLVLFTRGDELGLGKMEQRILTSGTGLQRLLQKCGNRYHVVNNRSKGDVTQVKELIMKLEKMVDGKKDGNGYLKLDNSVLLGLEADGKRRARERRKKQRQMEAHIQRGTIKAALMNDGPQGSELDAHQSFSKALRRLPEIRLVLLGERETGKSSAGNVILGKTGFFHAGAVTEECIRQQAEVSTRVVTVVDTPGWEAGVDSVTPERVKREIISSVALCPPGPHAFLLTLRVDNLQKVGHVKDHLELLGEGVWRHTIILFTHGDQLREGVEIEQHIQSGDKELRWLLEKCRSRYHVLCGGNGCSGGSLKITDLLEKVEKMAMMNRCEAFSSLVQEVRDMSWQRNERFNQRLKEMADKMLRQEAELKKIRDREVKSIRWFFERKRKVKSPEKADVQKEEEGDEDRRIGEAKNDIGELEERIRWLAEDREREIQDLSIENERICIALNQSQQKKQAMMLHLELKEREIEELKERTDEQQIKLLDLEQVCTEMEHKRKQREDAIRVEKHKWMKHQEMLEETITALKKDEAKWIVKIESLQVEMEQIEEKLFEKDQENEELKKETQELEKEMESKLEKMNRQHDKEIERQIEDKEMEIEELKLLHQGEMEQKMNEIQDEMDKKLKEKENEMEKIKLNCENERKSMQKKQEEEIVELKKEFAIKSKEQTETKNKETAEMEQMYFIRIEEMIQESEEEKQKINLNHKKEMEEKMEQAEKRAEALKIKHEDEMRSKSNEVIKLIEEIKTNHQEEINKILKQDQEDTERIQQKLSEKISLFEKEKLEEVEQLKDTFRREKEKQLEEKQRWIKDLEEKQRRIKDLEEKHEAHIEKNKLEEIDMLEKLQQKEKMVDELKHELKNKTEEVGNEKEITEKKSELVMKKESEIKNMMLSIKELQEDLVQREEKHKEDLSKLQTLEKGYREKEKKIEEMKQQTQELKDKLSEKERVNLDQQKDIKEQWEANEKEIRVLKEKINDLQKQLKETKEEKEKENLSSKKQIAQIVEENSREIEKLKQLIKEVEEILQRKDEEQEEMVLNQKKEAEKQLEDVEREMEEFRKQLMVEMGKKVKEKETEIKNMKQQAETMETKWREELKRTEEKEANETNKLIEALEEKAKDLSQLQSLLSLREGEIEEAMKLCANHRREIEELQESNEQKSIQVAELQRCISASQEKKSAEMNEKLQQKEETLELLLQKDKENEKEVSNLRLTIKQTKSELKDLTIKMELEMTTLIQEYEKKIARKNEDIEAMVKEKDRQRRSEEERQQIASVTAERYEASQEAMKELREQNEKLEKQAENFKKKFEELQKTCEDEKRDQMREFEEKVKNIQARIEERNTKVQSLKEANDKLHAEIEQLKVKEEKNNKLRQNFEKKMNGKEDEQKLNGEDGEHLGRENALAEREQIVLEEEKELKKRQKDLDAKQEELNEMKVKLKSKEQELQTVKNELEIRQKEQEEKDKRLQDISQKEKHVRKRESELEALLQALEGKQRELSSHGQDLQKKVKGLKDQGRELKDREYYLKNEEQELLNWKSELELRKEHVNYTTQELEEMRRDLALLKDELTIKEKTLKESLDKMSKWEQNLKEREEELHKREKTRGTDDSNEEENFAHLLAAGDNVSFMCREPGEGKEKEKGKEAEECAEDQRVKTALSASISNKSNRETLTEMEVPLRKKQTKSQRTEKVPLKSGRLNNRDFSVLEFRVIILGETWSSRSPPGLTIFSGEAPKLDRTTFRSWRGQTAGRCITVSEPLGLRWRDGPDPAGVTQRKSLLDSIAWCHPDANIILLLMPAFLTFTQKYRRAVEEHMGLLGEDSWRRTLVLFTWGEILGESPEQHILRNGELLTLVEKCGGRYHMLTSRKDKSTIESLFQKMEQIVTLNSSG